MNQIYYIYSQFLSYFPSQIHGIVSLVLALLLAAAVYQVIKRNFVYLILLIVLLPASVPILRNVWESAVEIIKFLLTKK